MKRYVLQLAVACVLVIGGFILLGIGGDIDLCDQTILSMSQEEYDSVKNHLELITGDSPSDREIAHWWIEHHRE